MSGGEQSRVMTAKCLRCGHDYGEDWGRHKCDECGGKVDIVRVINAPQQPAQTDHPNTGGGKDKPIIRL